MYVAPLEVAQQFSGLEGILVLLEDTIRSFKEVLEGRHDDVPEKAFWKCVLTSR